MSKKNQVLYYLSGLTCTDDNFIQKAGAQRVAAQRGVALVAPDTSPRGAGIAGEVRCEGGGFLVRVGVFLARGGKQPVCSLRFAVL